MLVEDGKDASEEAVRDGALVRVHVDDADVVLDGDGGRSLGDADGGDGSVDSTIARVAQDHVGRREDRIRDDNGAAAARVLDVLDADRDRRVRTDDLVHCHVVDDFGAVERQFSGFRRGDGVQQPGRGHLGRVGREDAVDFLPDLQLLGLERDGAQRGAQVRVAAADVAVNQTAGNVTEEASDDGNAVAAGLELLSKDADGCAVVGRVERVGSLDVDRIAKVDVFRSNALPSKTSVSKTHPRRQIQNNVPSSLAGPP